jgi:hypothetical protein
MANPANITASKPLATAAVRSLTAIMLDMVTYTHTSAVTETNQRYCCSVNRAVTGATRYRYNHHFNSNYYDLHHIRGCSVAH